MEYVNQRGSFDDVPLDQIVADFQRLYPRWLEHTGAMQQADFLAEVAGENPAS
jgi:hypothetical protein